MWIADTVELPITNLSSVLKTCGLKFLVLYRCFCRLTCHLLLTFLGLCPLFVLLSRAIFMGGAEGDVTLPH